MKNSAQIPTIDHHSLATILSAENPDPFACLGMHEVSNQIVVRVFRPDAATVTIRATDSSNSTYPALQVHPDGFFEAVLPPTLTRFPYVLDCTTADGHAWTEQDPYAFGALLDSSDLDQMNRGEHWELYRKLGAHLTAIEGVAGVTFRVWAPNAQRVSVVGDFNAWDGRRHPMRKYGNGVWEIFLPSITEGAHYKFEVRQSHGAIVKKSDPWAFFGQHGPSTASLVFDLNRFTWSDTDLAWMKARRPKSPHLEPMSIYEVHLGSWKRHVEENRPLSYRELAETLLPYVVEMGYTHLELLPVAEHPCDESWGYQITGYFAPTSRFGDPDEFRYFIDRCHAAGIGVILDWVPGHFITDEHGLANFDGTHLYEHADPRQGQQMDWGTLNFNFGRHEVRNFLIANALFWFDQFHIDGLRVDGVASMLYLDYSRKPGQWVPNQYGGNENLEAIAFLKSFNEVSYSRFPGIFTIAEESTAWPGVSQPTYLGGLGFGLKWNLGWMHDFLDFMHRDPSHRKFHQGDITFSLLYAFKEHFVLVLSHDEVVHGKKSLLSKMPGDRWQQFANLRLLYAWMFAHPGKKLLFMGGEFGQLHEWNHRQSLDWHLCDQPDHAGLQRLVKDLNHLYKNQPALFDQDDTYDSFQWIDFQDNDHSVFSFLRKSREGETIAFIINATPVPREGYRIGVPSEGWWKEIINTDSSTYGGSNIGNLGGQNSLSEPWQGLPNSLLLTLPPLAVIGLKYQPIPTPPPVLQKISVAPSK